MELVPSPAPAPEISAAPAAPPRLFLRSVVHRPGPIWNPFAQDRLFLSEVVSTGDLRGEDFRIRDGFSARAHGDSVIVRYPRFGLLRTAGEVAVIGGAAIALHELGVFRVVWDLLPF